MTRLVLVRHGEAQSAVDEPEQDCDLCELHVGEAVDGQPWEQVRDKYPWPVEAFTPWMPGAESWAEFAWRVTRRLRRLIAEHPDQTVVVACHGGVVDASFFALGGVGIEQSAPPGNVTGPVENTSLTEWALTDEGRWSLVRFNDAAHLEGLAP